MQYHLGNFSFETEQEYRKALRELKYIVSLKAKCDFTKPAVAKKLLEAKQEGTLRLETKVGIAFLQQLKEIARNGAPKAEAIRQMLEPQDEKPGEIREVTLEELEMAVQGAASKEVQENKQTETFEPEEYVASNRTEDFEADEYIRNNRAENSELEELATSERRASVKADTPLADFARQVERAASAMEYASEPRERFATPEEILRQAKEELRAERGEAAETFTRHKAYTWEEELENDPFLRGSSVQEKQIIDAAKKLLEQMSSELVQANAQASAEAERVRFNRALEKKHETELPRGFIKDENEELEDELAFQQLMASAPATKPTRKAKSEEKRRIRQEYRESLLARVAETNANYKGTYLEEFFFLILRGMLITPFLGFALETLLANIGRFYFLIPAEYTAVLVTAKFALPFAVIILVMYGYGIYNGHAKGNGQIYLEQFIKVFFMVGFAFYLMQAFDANFDFQHEVKAVWSMDNLRMGVYGSFVKESLQGDMDPYLASIIVAIGAALPYEKLVMMVLKKVLCPVAGLVPERTLEKVLVARPENKRAVPKAMRQFVQAYGMYFLVITALVGVIRVTGAKEIQRKTKDYDVVASTEPSNRVGLVDFNKSEAVGAQAKEQFTPITEEDISTMKDKLRSDFPAMDARALDAYAEILARVANGESISTPGEQVQFDRNKETPNVYTIYDLDADGKLELLVSLRDQAEEKREDILFYYDSIERVAKEEGRWSSNADYYSNGSVCEYWTSNTALYAEMNPFNVMKRTGKKYYQAYAVCAWEKAYMPADSAGTPFPDYIDANGNGLIYSINVGETVWTDDTEYQRVIAECFADATCLKLNWVKIAN